MEVNNEDAEIEQDILKLQLHSVPLNLNWENNEEEVDDSEEDDEEEGDFAVGLPPSAEPEASQLTFIDLDNQPSTSQAAASQESTNINNDDDNVSQNEDDSGDEELIDLSRHFEPTPLNLLKLNFAYQEVIEQQIATVDSLLQENHFKKSIINEGIARSSKSNEGHPKIYCGLFNKLFFKDDRGFGPTNPDLERRRAEIGNDFSANILPAPKWKKDTSQSLIQGVERNAQRKLMEPFYTQLEYLREKLKSDPDNKEVKAKVDEVKKKLKDMKAIPPSKLVGDRDEPYDWASISNLELGSKQTAQNCELYWRNFLHPSINHAAWSKEEDQKLTELISVHKNHDWRVITKELGTNRAIIDVVKRYQLKINTSFRSRPWTPEEDALLLKLVEKYRVGDVVPYTRIALQMKNRYATQIVHRWMKSLDPAIKHTKFTPEEDAALLRAVRIHGEKWSRIRDLGVLPGRSDAQIRERYKNALGSRKGSWTRQDDELLMDLVEEYGEGNWSSLSQRMPGRTDCQCLRRYTSIVRNRRKGKGMAYRRDTAKNGKILRIRRKLKHAINAEDISVMREEIKDGEDKGLKKTKLTLLTKSMKNGMSSEELLKLYSNVTSETPKKYVHKRAPKTPEEKQLKEDLYKLISDGFQPMRESAQTPGTVFHSCLERTRENSKNIGIKDIFVHFIKALNVNAEKALESIKQKAKSARQAKHRQESASVNGGKENESSQSEKKSANVFARNLYLPLCAPNSATVLAYRALSKDRERRVTSAKTILNLPNISKEDGQESEPETSAEKHDPEELLAHLRGTYKYKIFRSRFNALMTWPTLLSTLVPYVNRETDGSIQPAVRTRRPLEPDPESPPPKKSKLE